MSIARLMQMGAAGNAGVVWTDPDLANASYDSVSFSVSGEDTSPRDLFFKPDGLIMYVVGDLGDDINQYSLSSAWDISTASYVGNFSVASQDGNPTGLYFKSNGLAMYVLGGVNDSVFEYTLGTAWDISTASYSQSFSVSSQEVSPHSISFKEDGSKMYILGISGDDINEYDLSVYWDISTASYTQSFSVVSQEGSPLGLFFAPNGEAFYITGIGNDSVFEYTLSTAWDISTASYVQGFSISAQDGNPNGVFFKSDGSKMYICGDATDTIYQYSTA